LRELFPDEAFQCAVTTAETIASKTEDRAMYDEREKAQRDYLWALEGARQEGMEKGIEEGREEGLLVGKSSCFSNYLMKRCPRRIAC